ncbi:UPF0676 protein [Talaromyces islandicus]|uniref:UPF0676 protein n=1 Tax=Talaromyces islandicus TaxID=28573 RepID=A0A0U1LRJ6_TALIS|nr:UPF0676 protein [Talaromyces islandicus]
MAASLEIPLIDISPFLDDSASHASRDAVVDQVRNACMTYGFFQLEGHGVPVHLQEAMLECAKTFFDLPLEKKTAVGMDKAMGKSNRGYEVIGGQTLQPDTLPDLKEGFYIGEEMSPDNPKAGSFLRGPNLWPDLPEEKFRQPINEYYQHMLTLDHLILKVITSGMPYAPEILAEFTTDPNATLRLLHYPPQKSKDARQLGAGAHTDFGCITLLLQQPDQTGLQVLYPPTNSWIPVPAVANRFVVNVGDLLYGWTKGEYRSAVHRVINNGPQHRYSVPFFYTGNLSFKLRPLDGSEDANGITVEQHVMARYNTTYAVK